MSYAAVPPSMFDESFCRLTTPAQLLELYLRSCPQRNSEGLFRFKFGAVADHLGMDADEARPALSELLTSGRPFLYDWDAGLILDLDALRVQPIGKVKDYGGWTVDGKVEKRVPGAISKLKELPPTDLIKALLHLADAYAPQFADAMRHEFDLPEPDTEEYDACHPSKFDIATGRPKEAPSLAPIQAPSEAPWEAPSHDLARELERTG